MSVHAPNLTFFLLDGFIGTLSFWGFQLQSILFCLGAQAHKLKSITEILISILKLQGSGEEATAFQSHKEA